MSHSPSTFSPWLLSNGPEMVLESIGDFLGETALIIVDAEDRILFWSRGAQRLLKIDGSEAVGRDCREMLRCDEADDLREAAGKGLIVEETRKIKRGDGTSVEIYRHSRAFYDTTGRFVGHLEVLVPGERTTRPTATLEYFAGNTERFHGLITRDPSMRQAFQIVRNVALTDTTVLIRGESGSGKELIARALHAESHRRNGPFLAVNCAALSPSLLESELFGHVRGAFTGAIRDHAGLFQRADRGTLFLDEVAELPMGLQAKLLRALQERSFIPVGADRPVEVDVRIVAATHRSLREEVKEGRFREDLMYRLRVVPIFLPSLRERRCDIPLLLWHAINRHNAAGPRRITRIDPGAMRLLLDHAWPGNVRELQNVVEYTFAVGRGEELLIEDLPPEFREEHLAAPAPDIEEAHHDADLEKEQIRQALAQTRGRIGEAAERLGMSRATFWRKRKKYGV